MRIVLLGAPGTGKGTQANKLMEKYSIAVISTGDILRKAVADDLPLGKDAKAYMEKGELVPNSIVLGLVHARLKKDDCKKGFVIHGFPRNEAQAIALDKLLSATKTPLTNAVSIDLSSDELSRRMAGRRICTSCGQSYNIYSLPPKTEGRCDKCGGSLYQRNDDREETIRKRLQVYDSQKLSLLDYYRREGILKPVSGTGSVDDIFREICSAIHYSGSGR